MDVGGVARVWRLERALKHDRPGVDALVDEVHGDAEDLDAVLDGLLDRAHAREGGQQRGMDVEDPVGEARHEARVEDRHVAGEDDELDALGLEPIGDCGIALGPRAVLRAQEYARRNAGRRRPGQRRRRRLIAGYRDHLDLVAVDAVEQRLEVRALARGQDPDLQAASPRRNFG